MPEHAKVRHIAEHQGMGYLWAEVDDAMPLEERTFHIIGTGLPIDRRFRYVGTFLMGLFVWHVFEDLTEMIKKLDTKLFENTNLAMPEVEKKE